MKIHDLVTSKLIENRYKRNKGELIAIPWESLPRLSRVIPGVQQGKYVVITAGPKAGKTQLADFLYVYEPFEWWMRNRTHQKIIPKVLYFSLEMSREAKILQAMSYKLNTTYGISISPENLKSTFKDYILSDKIMGIISSDSFKLWLNEFETCVTFVDSCRSVEEIDKHVMNYAGNHGSFVKDEHNNSRYIPNNPNEYVIVLVDHLSLIMPKEGKIFNSILEYSSQKSLFYRDKLNYCVVNVQQQASDSLKQQFDYKGSSIIEKIRPSPEGLADCKYTARDVNLMISLFYPRYYNFENYEGVDLDKIGRWHRELYINLNRDGISNAMIQLYFNGAVNEFYELPHKLKSEDYEIINNRVKNLI